MMKKISEQKKNLICVQFYIFILHLHLLRLVYCLCQDEIGTPFCVTYDFDSEEDGAVTVRDRDTMEQERIKIEDLKEYFEQKFEF